MDVFKEKFRAKNAGHGELADQCRSTSCQRALSGSDTENPGATATRAVEVHRFVLVGNAPVAEPDSEEDKVRGGDGKSIVRIPQ